MIRLTGTEYTITPMALDMTGSGRTIFNTGLGSKPGPTARNMRETTRRARSMDTVRLSQIFMNSRKNKFIY